MDCYAVADQMVADGMTVDEPYRDERIPLPTALVNPGP